MPLNRRCGFIFRKVSPLIEKSQFFRRRIVRFEYFKSVSLRLFEERVAVDIVHDHDTEHSGEIGEAPAPPNVLLYDHE